LCREVALCRPALFLYNNTHLIVSLSLKPWKKYGLGEQQWT
jgi:hypothetical protein